MSVTTTQTTTTNNNTIPLKSASTPNDPVPATLNFYGGTSDGGAPYNYVEAPPDGTPRSNIITSPVSVSINDIRGRESSFNIDKNAFLPVLASDLTRDTDTNSDTAGGGTIDFDSESSIKTAYYAQVERVLLQNLPGSPKRVYIFDHTIRRQNPAPSPSNTSNGTTISASPKREPVLRTHIDQTPTSALERVRFHLPSEADTLLQSRVRLVNVWRPLNGPVESSPLAVADSSTVSDAQLIGVEHRYPDRTGETAAIRHDENTRWWFWSGMRNDERLLLQCFDSESRSRVPHSAFKLPGEDQPGWEGRPRESIEVRALVFG